MTRDELKAEALRLHEAEGLGGRAIARRLDFAVSRTTVNRWIYPGLQEKLYLSSRDAKRRRKGTCRDCGKITSYNGTNSKGVSDLCIKCAARRTGDKSMIWTKELIIERIREWAMLYGEPPAIPDWSPVSAREIGDEQRALRFEQANGHWPWFTTVYRRFGSWNNAIREAGFEPRRRDGGGGNQARRRKKATA